MNSEKLIPFLCGLVVLVIGTAFFYARVGFQTKLDGIGASLSTMCVTSSGAGVRTPDSRIFWSGAASWPRGTSTTNARQKKLCAGGVRKMGLSWRTSSRAKVAAALHQNHPSHMNMRSVQ